MLNFGIKLPLFICTASAPFRWQCFCWFNSLRNIAHFLWMSLELGLPLDKLHTHKSLWEKPFFTLSWCLNKWGTMHLSFLEHLLFERLLNLCKGTFVWLNNTIRHHLFFFFPEVWTKSFTVIPWNLSFNQVLPANLFICSLLENHFLILELFAIWNGYEFLKKLLIPGFFLLNSPIYFSSFTFVRRKPGSTFSILLGNILNQIMHFIRNIFCFPHNYRWQCCWAFCPYIIKILLFSVFDNLHLHSFFEPSLAASPKSRFWLKMCSRQFRLSLSIAPYNPVTFIHLLALKTFLYF